MQEQPDPTTQKERQKPKKENAINRLLRQRQEKKAAEQKQLELKENWKRRSESSKKLHYHERDGIISMTSVANEAGTVTPIEAPGFRDCGPLVLMSENGVTVIHASPYTLDESEGKPTEYAINPKDTDLDAHLNTTLHQLYPDTSNPENTDPNRPLTDAQLDQAEADLRIIVVGGNLANAGVLSSRIEGRNARIERPDGQTFRFPKPRERVLYDYGNGPKTIQADNHQVLLMNEADPNHNIREIYPANGEQLNVK